MIHTIYLTGEGASDLGQCHQYNLHDGKACDSAGFNLGPMTELLVKQLRLVNDDKRTWIADMLESIDTHAINFIYFSRGALSAFAKGTALKNYNRPSARTPKGLAADAMHSYALGVIAKQNEACLAVIFHDVDGTRSERSLNARRYDELRQAFHAGFEAAEYNHGVAMVPKPKSEAWLICAVDGYVNGAVLEESLSGNDRSPQNAAKVVLVEKIGEEATTEKQAEIVIHQVDANSLRCMPSYNDFADDLTRAVLAH